MRLEASIQHRPILSLTAVFLAWKVLILFVVLLSPGIGYDTSTSILLHDGRDTPTFDHTPNHMGNRMMNLVRWDAIYYSQMAQRGHLFEQEWAFGVGLSTTISYLTRFTLGGHALQQFVLVGIIVSHMAHWLSTILLWSIAYQVIHPKATHRSSLAFVAAALHIVSPAGVFLSAPYAESLFSCLSMLGYYLYVNFSPAVATSNPSALLGTILAGVVFGCATVIRSNGVLNGLPFLVDAITHLRKILVTRAVSDAKFTSFKNLVFTVLGGSFIAVGMVVPQVIAYQDYCMAREVPRPWCNSTIPSIFTWVQSHYWNVGFLRYWTMSNIPLFLLAAPVLYALMLSGFDGCRRSWTNRSPSILVPKLAGQLALPQLVLAILALTSYHVQIITRLSSGSPFWYIWLATKLGGWKYSNAYVRIMIGYGLIQAGLYASFLPPA